MGGYLYMQQWEYKICKLSGRAMSTIELPTEEELNELGKDGWELATSMTDKTDFDNTLIYKRPKK
ncbi:DUF4177 domain-containing protein [Halocatena pleomorpha]|uniref:DUF4177 domain-containing protein n=1 Tax=Halocatena pleomorpha TaxID=1785090 RepID=A0A3P3REJ8_9EURY|nr:DUF4177 domain-containing protein [Halocatena pleomorpha]RRJ31388.1 DUF4177 domain-containing protein [Halocatena pleomorpha]